MAVLLLFAFVSGIVTILSPCILPVLPIVLSGGIGSGKARPLGVVAGFAASFTAFTLTLSAIVHALRVPANALRIVAVVLIMLFGLTMVVPRLSEGFAMLASRLANRRGAAADANVERRRGFWSGIPIGVSLGIVWTPCVGPIMASVISLALTRNVDAGSLLITLAYTLGTSIPMFAVMIGGRALIARIPALTRHAGGIQRGFGALMILAGVAIALGLDLRFQTALLDAFPGYGSGLTAIEKASQVRTALDARASGQKGKPGAAEGKLGDYGPAPPFVTRGNWFNTSSASLTMGDLRGKVVLIDFWTYSCVNCLRTLPYLKAWNRAYGGKGLVIVGVHTPEFEFEKSPANVGRAIKDLGIAWPVVQDNNYEQWNAYANQYWPADYVVDADGNVRYFHFGEGDYDGSEDVIRTLLREAGRAVGKVSVPAYRVASGTPETYLGYARAQGFTSAVALVPDQAVDYRPAGAAGNPRNGRWSLSGRWTVTGEYAMPQASGSLELGFDAKNVFLVVEPQGAGGRVQVKVDGRRSADTPDVKDGLLVPGESRLYQLVGLADPGPHILRLDVTGSLRLFAFTFG